MTITRHNPLEDLALIVQRLKGNQEDGYNTVVQSENDKKPVTINLHALGGLIADAYELGRNITYDDIQAKVTSNAELIVEEMVSERLGISLAEFSRLIDFWYEVFRRDSQCLDQVIRILREKDETRFKEDLSSLPTIVVLRQALGLPPAGVSRR